MRQKEAKSLKKRCCSGGTSGSSGSCNRSAWLAVTFPLDELVMTSDSASETPPCVERLYTAIMLMLMRFSPVRPSLGHLVVTSAHYTQSAWTEVVDSTLTTSSRSRDKSGDDAKKEKKPHPIPRLKLIYLAELESLLGPDMNIQHIRAIATNHIGNGEVLVWTGWIFVCFE